MADQLIGTKKIQQVFAEPGIVERFIKDPEAVRRIRRTFTGLYTLDPVSMILYFTSCERDSIPYIMVKHH